MSGVLGGRIWVGLMVLGAFACVALASGCGGGGGGGGNAPTAAQLRAQEIQVGTFKKYLPGTDPDELDRSGLDISDVVRTITPGHYEVIVQNFSNIGFINSFWFHTTNVKITKVVSSTMGTCTLLDDNTISCDNMKLAPPKCTCQTGGIMKFRFDGKPLAANHGIDGGIALHDTTPVPYHIPSYLNSQANVLDLPICQPGQKSSSAHRCVHSH
jgi:hypothetical protein